MFFLYQNYCLTKLITEVLSFSYSLSLFVFVSSGKNFNLNSYLLKFIVRWVINFTEKDILSFKDVCRWRNWYWMMEKQKILISSGESFVVVKVNVVVIYKKIEERWTIFKSRKLHFSHSFSSFYHYFLLLFTPYTISCYNIITTSSSLR